MTQVIECLPSKLKALSSLPRVEDEKGEKNISECYLKIQVGNEGG
jgi:hypothetical protein